MARKLVQHDHAGEKRPWTVAFEIMTRRQLLVIDDVRVITMTELWRSFPIAKFDATSFGHWSGTGLAIREPRS